MKKVLIVGTGIISALTSYLLRQKFVSDLIHITIWDKARGPGGRMSTARSKKIPNCHVDLGLQYISTSKELLKTNEDIYQLLFNENLLEPLKAKIEGYNSQRKDLLHFITPNGSSSVVKYFINKANINEIYYNTFLETFKKTDTGQIEVLSKEGKKDTFDVVILTMPAPQISELLERSTSMFDISKEKSALKAIEFSARYALGLFFDQNFTVPFDIKYFDNDDIIRYVSFDNVKRNRINEPISVCIHTTKYYFNEMYLRNTDASAVEFEIYKKVRDLFPDWPLPVETKLQKWRYSQVSDPYPDNIGYIIYNKKPLILCTGDSYVNHSNFDNCIHSAKQSVRVLEEYIKN